MGLLSDSSGRDKLISFINQYGTKVGIISYLSGIIWMVLLANHEFNAKNYFSENQLLPGMVDTYFSNTHQFYKHLRELQKICKADEENVQTRMNVKKEMEQLNLDVYEQKFHVVSKGINGTNLFGIYRSPRASGVESIILNVPNHGGCNSSTGIAMMLSLARFFRMQTYWAKDIIFLLTEHQLYGTQSWLSAYFQDEISDIVTAPLEGHGGSIQASITLDLESENIAYLDISINGLNGLLPNLDLVHLLVRIANFESIPVKLEFQNSMYVRPNDFKRSFETLLKNMAFQCSGIPSGNHGLFYKYRIEAYTLKSVTSNPRVRSGHPIDFESLGRFIEGVFRSLNNLLEHVHQSFFMYLLPNTNRYVSIGLYMPPLACMTVPLLIYLIKIWVQLFQAKLREERRLSILVDEDVMITFIRALFLSWFINWTKELPFTSLCCVWIMILFHPEGWLGTVWTRQFYTNLLLTTIIALTSTFNFSLAFFVALVYVPACLTIPGSTSKWLRFFCLIPSHPYIFTFLISILKNVQFDQNQFDWNELMAISFEHYQSQIGIMEEYKNIGLWTHHILFTALLALWILLADSLFEDENKSPYRTSTFTPCAASKVTYFEKYLGKGLMTNLQYKLIKRLNMGQRETKIKQNTEQKPNRFCRLL